jgi:hypothetical protein
MNAEITVPILVAFLAGGITLVNPLVTRSNLVSGFRQTWIDQQRGDLAIVVSKAILLSSNHSSNWAQDIEAFEAAASRIRLRQNPKKRAEWAIVILQINELHKELWDKRGHWHDVSDRLNKLQDEAQTPLKDNWNKTRHGEMVHLVSLGVAAFAIIAAVSALAYSAFTSKDEKDAAGAAVRPVAVLACPPQAKLTGMVSAAGPHVLPVPPASDPHAAASKVPQD